MKERGPTPIAGSCLMRVPVRLLPIAFAILLLFTGCATQEDLMVVYNRVMTLESQQKETGSELTQMKGNLDETLAQWNTDKSALREDVAELRNSFNATRSEVRALYGMMEEHGYQLKEKTGAIQAKDTRAQEAVTLLEARLDSMRDALLRMEAYLGLEGAPPPPAKQGEKAPEAPNLEAMSEDQVYAQAKKDFDEGRMEAARDGFKTFLTRFPSSANADNAIFWIGESFFQEKWYEKAILQYQDVIEKHPKANKVPAAYLKQGMAFSMLGDNSNAKLIWTELIKKFPGSAEAGLAQKKIDAMNK